MRILSGFESLFIFQLEHCAGNGKVSVTALLGKTIDYRKQKPTAIFFFVKHNMFTTNNLIFLDITAQNMKQIN